MKKLRVVIAGTVGAGKTTFVKSASDIDVVEIERDLTDKSLSVKKKTTVAFDFGKLILDDQDLHIYGTPGQSRFDFMWDILIKDADRYILLVAANQPNGFSYAREILTFMNERVQVPFIIGMTHRDCPDALSPEEIADSIGIANTNNSPPIITVNPNIRTSVIEALSVLVSHEL
ncbi:GTP-binding protein [Limnofasciculus baicalensis]|uniref:ATP/GTP-binding protein n=1 Tax=Limnofasciculus baicalensis BBK-W-15 TaxID=2699891 RepID=A0AAE3GWX4_9CYAN|nr:ATP/GTP-binding protein [Limnofasciculus baicalensis]MCP2731391.1 ATP/GTP-binding protein [Limnofasciculus baicalensis BBK-W-15]